jgi:hypothetical protein
MPFGRQDGGLNTHPSDENQFQPTNQPREVESLIRHHINHIIKLEFLPAFKIAFDRSFTSANIFSAFRGAGLVPLQPETVLSKLDVQLRTPTPPAATTEALWEARTPSNVRELEAQSSLIRERVRQHKNSSPASIIESRRCVRADFLEGPPLERSEQPVAYCPARRNRKPISLPLSQQRRKRSGCLCQSETSIPNMTNVVCWSFLLEPN